MAALLTSARRNVPVIFQTSQILKIGKQPISTQIGGKYYADSPSYGPNLGVRFNFHLALPDREAPRTHREGQLRDVTISSIYQYSLGPPSSSGSCGREKNAKAKRRFPQSLTTIFING